MKQIRGSELCSVLYFEFVAIISSYIIILLYCASIYYRNEYDDTILVLDALKVTANIVFGYAT